jgi:tetratricopeptide (TPR) repeat protein
MKRTGWRPATPILGVLALLVATGPAARASSGGDWPLFVSLQTAAPSDVEYDKAAALAAAGKLSEARSIFQAAAKQDPGDGALTAAVEMFRDLEAGRVSADAVRKIFQAFQEGDAGKWNEAHAGIDEVLRLAPQYARAHSAKATLLIMQGQYANGVAALDRALSIDPKFAEAYYNRGAARAELKQFDAAIADYTRAIELQPSFWDAYRNRGSARTFKNDPQGAIADFTKAIALRPRDVDSRFLRGVVYAAIDQWDPAMADFNRVIELDPTHATAHYNRGLGRQQRGELEAALTEYTRAIELDATDPSPFINRGLIYAGRRDYARAIADYDKVLAIDPDFALAHFNKAKALEQSGRATEAVAAYRAFIAKAGSGNRELVAEARQRITALERPRPK